MEPRATDDTTPTPANARVEWLSIGIACFSIAILVGLWSAVEFLVREEREVKVSEVMEENANLTRAFEEHTIRTLEYIDAVLVRLKRNYETQGKRLDLPGFFKDLQINPTIIGNMVITDETGMIILGSHRAPRISLADLEHIKVHFDKDTNRLFFSKPLLARFNKKWSIVATRRANKSDGSLAGVVAIAVDPFYFSDFYKELDLGRNGIVALVGLDGIVRARLGENPQGVGLDLSRADLFRHIGTASHGSYVAKSVVDGISRIHSYRVVRGYPLVVTVASSVDESLADVEHRARTYRLAASLATLVIAALSVGLIVFGLRQQRAIAIARSHHLLKAIMDHSSAMIALRDLAWRYILVNKAWAASIGKTPAEAEGKTVRELFQPPVCDKLEADNRLVAKNRSAREFEDVIPDASGERTRLTVKFPLFEPDGSMYAIGSVSTDITQRKQWEDQIERFNDELQQKAADLASVNQELDAFSYSVSHDLRAPLRSIAGFSNILLKQNCEQLDAEGRDRLQRIVAATVRMGKLIDDLLNLSRIARQPLSDGQVNLSAVAREISDGLAEASPERRVEVSIARDLTAWADPGLMRIVMDNLIGNAWKFSAKTAEARIEVGSTNRDGDTVFYVRDNGAGFNMTYSEKLFRPFQRLHSVDEFEGTGIGLATMKRIITRHRGKIWIESAVNNGTTVFFTLGKQT
jgi:hypothetical protein